MEDDFLFDLGAQQYSFLNHCCNDEMETQTCFLVELIEINHYCQYFCLTLALPISFHVGHKSSQLIPKYHIHAVTAAVVCLLIMQEFSACGVCTKSQSLLHSAVYNVPCILC